MVIKEQETGESFPIILNVENLNEEEEKYCFENTTKAIIHEMVKVSISTRKEGTKYFIYGFLLS